MNASNKEVAFVGTGIPPGWVDKVCGSVVWALPIQRESKGQPTHSGSRLCPSHDIQLESVSKTASKAETIEEEDNKESAEGQWLCESEREERKKKCVIENVWGRHRCRNVCRCDHPGVQKRPTPTLTFLCVEGNGKDIVDMQILNRHRVSRESTSTCSGKTCRRWAPPRLKAAGNLQNNNSWLSVQATRSGAPSGSVGFFTSHPYVVTDRKGWNKVICNTANLLCIHSLTTRLI